MYNPDYRFEAGNSITRQLICRTRTVQLISLMRTNCKELSERYIHRTLFSILYNQTEIRLYLLFQISQKMVNTIWFPFGLISFWKCFSCVFKNTRETDLCCYTRAKYFQNLIKPNVNQIVFAIFRLILNQTDVRLVPNQLENGKYNLISLWLNKISKRFLLCVPQGALFSILLTH